MYVSNTEGQVKKFDRWSGISVLDVARLGYIIDMKYFFIFLCYRTSVTSLK